jgi:hypothetical protein
MKIIFLLSISISIIVGNYWDTVEYNKWYDVPHDVLLKDLNLSLDSSEIQSLSILLYQEADFIGILRANKYKKIQCNVESSLCGEYKAKVLVVFKGEKKLQKIVFIDDLTNSPEVYLENAIYILYKEDNIYYQDEFIQILPTQKWIKFFQKLSMNKVEINNKAYKSLYSFCKSTGIKESEIRALNPWINKKATNIPPNAEIIIPNLNKEENNESK